MKSVFPLWDLDLVIRNAGAERVSEEASIRLDRLLSEQAARLLVDAGKYARHAGRRQIKREDIVLAARYQKR